MQQNNKNEKINYGHFLNNPRIETFQNSYHCHVKRIIESVV